MDKFMDILKRYREGTATEEERRIVEDEIEKNRAINDLIAAEFEDEFHLGLDKLENGMNDSGELEGKTKRKNEDFADITRKAVNKRFRNIMVMSVALIILIYAVVHLVVSPVMDSIYYDPGDNTIDHYSKDIEYDMAAFTELNIPGYRCTSFTTVIPKGFGEYDLVIRRRNLFKGENERIDISQSRNNIEGFFDYKFGYDMFLNRPGGDEEENSVFDYKVPLEELTEMDERNYVSAFVVFNDNITILENEKIQEKYELVFKWLAVDTGSEAEMEYGDYLGFNPDLSDGMRVDEEFDRAKYPYFDLADMYEKKSDEVYGKSYPEKHAFYYEEHFKSLLKYMIDQEEFVSIYDLGSNRYGNYNKALEYVEENGVKIYAALIFGEVGDVVEFIENEDIYSIQINDVKVSKY